MHITDSAPDDQLTRVECVVREYPSQATTPGLGDDMMNFIAEFPQFSAERLVQSGVREEKAVQILHC